MQPHLRQHLRRQLTRRLCRQGGYLALDNPTLQERLELHKMAADGLIEFEARTTGLVCWLKWSETSPEKSPHTDKKAF
jgi:hypothetical protein